MCQEIQVTYTLKTNSGIFIFSLLLWALLGPTLFYNITTVNIFAQ